MRASIAAVFLTVLFSAAASAQTETPLFGSEWRAIVSGKTLHFELDGQPAGKMYVLSRSSNFVFHDADGRCYRGWFQGRGDEVKYHYIAKRKPSRYEHVKIGSQYVLKDLDSGARLAVAKMTNERLRCSSNKTPQQLLEQRKKRLDALTRKQKRVPGIAVVEVVDAMSGRVGPVFFDRPYGPSNGLRIHLRVKTVQRTEAVDVMRRLCAARDRGKRLGDASTIEIVNSAGKQGWRHYSGVKACSPAAGVSRQASISALSRF